MAMKLPHPQGLPATIASTRVRMDTHSKEVHAGRTKRLYNTDAKEKRGADCRARTDDLQITKLSLYQTELTRHIWTATAFAPRSRIYIAVWRKCRVKTQQQNHGDCRAVA